VEQFLTAADREARELVRLSWARFDAALPSRHQPPERGAQR
jgi:hypothetical protein